MWVAKRKYARYCEVGTRKYKFNDLYKFMLIFFTNGCLPVFSKPKYCNIQNHNFTCCLCVCVKRDL
jgi:hypothetical protein